MATGKTDAEFKQEVKALVGDEYTPLTTYVNRSEKITMRHNTCGTEYQVAPTNFLRGNRCPKCFRKRKRVLPEEFARRFSKLVGDEYTQLTPYVKTSQKIKVRHNRCGNVYEVTPNNFLRGKRCRQCYISDQYKTSDEFAAEVAKLTNNRIVLAEPYKGEYHVMTFTCLKHDCTFSMTPAGFLKSDTERCPICHYEKTQDKYRFSTPARKIWKHLVDIKEPYQMEKRFDDCRNYALLPFDFYLPERNLLIEYDGQQHLNPSRKFRGDSTYNRVHTNDSIKNMYARITGIHLLRIPYTEENYKDVIDQYLAGKLPKKSPYIINQLGFYLVLASPI